MNTCVSVLVIPMLAELLYGCCFCLVISPPYHHQQLLVGKDNFLALRIFTVLI